MARRAKQPNQNHRNPALGAWYCVDIDDNRSPLVALRAGKASGAEIEAEADSSFWVRLLPMTGEELAEAQSAHVTGAMSFKIDRKARRATLDQDVDRATKNLTYSIIAARCLEVRGYVGRNGVTGEEYRPTTGEELVQFILTECDPSERDVLSDIFEALTDSSRLESGLGEAFGLPHASSRPGTPRSVGDAPGAADLLGSSLTRAS